MTTLKVEDINIDALIKDAGWFHFSGNTLSLSEDVRKLF